MLPHSISRPRGLYPQVLNKNGDELMLTVVSAVWRDPACTLDQRAQKLAWIRHPCRSADAAYLIATNISYLKRNPTRAGETNCIGIVNPAEEQVEHVPANHRCHADPPIILLCISYHRFHIANKAHLAEMSYRTASALLIDLGVITYPCRTTPAPTSARR